MKRTPACHGTMPPIIRDILWVQALFFFVALTIGLSLAGLWGGALLADAWGLTAETQQGLVLRCVTLISGMALGMAGGFSLGFLFGRTRFIAGG